MTRKNKVIPYKSPTRDLSCESKRRFTTEKQALEAAEYQMLVQPFLELGVYNCGQCGGWHLTNTEKR